MACPILIKGRMKIDNVPVRISANRIHIPYGSILEYCQAIPGGKSPVTIRPPSRGGIGIRFKQGERT